MKEQQEKEMIKEKKEQEKREKALLRKQEKEKKICAFKKVFKRANYFPPTFLEALREQSIEGIEAFKLHLRRPIEELQLQQLNSKSLLSCIFFC